MAKQIKVGVVGCGYWGPNLIRNFRFLSDCNLRMICDLSEERLSHLKALYPEVQGTTDYRHLLNGAGLDAVVIATAVNTHYPMARASLLAGKHTFIEKPMASSSAECQELIAIAQRKGVVLMTGHTFLYSPAVRKIKEIVDQGDIGEIRYICARRLNLGLFQKDINVAWDLAPHDISIVLNIMGEQPLTVNCRGSAHITPGVEDVTTMCLSFPNQKSAIIQSSWLDPRKVREMTIVGSKRMIVYDDVAPLEKIRIFDARVERPPHYDTFAEFHYAYHYGDVYAPYVKQEEPLKTECQHFLDCIRSGATPLTSGQQGLELVRILEASSESMRLGGSPVEFGSRLNGERPVRPVSGRPARLAVPKIAVNEVGRQNGRQKYSTPADPKIRIKIQMNGKANESQAEAR
jgi:predicted dehydrogenase